MTFLPFALVLAGLGAEPGSRVPSHSVDFSREVQPILSNHCYQCHGPDDRARKAELRLDERAGATQKLPSANRAIVPGKPEESELLARLLSEDSNERMPPIKLGRKPTAREVEVVRRWIEQGATYSKHWAYEVPVRQPLPDVSESSWAANPIDFFIRARLDRERLKPASPADKYTLLRRLSLDLIGLPPTKAEADHFANDTRPDAYERAVEGLLAKPAYGERWAAMWLDLGRYGDSAGYIHDPPRSIWRWRDWLIQALNDNVPYDRFTSDMIAGDLFSSPTREQIVATGFHRNTTTNTEGGANAEEYHFAAVVDRINTTMQVWLGTTFACAQCHNHKYDPFSQKEYYQFFAFFNNTADFNSEEPSVEVPRVGREREYESLLAKLTQAKKQFGELTRQVDQIRADWEKSLDRKGLPKELIDALTVATEKRTPAQADLVVSKHRSSSRDWLTREAEVKRLRAELDQVAATTLIMRESTPRPTHVAIRGSFQNLGEAVSPGVPAVLNPLPSGAKPDRLTLARWIVDPKNPLTARVAVNRLWQEIFGVGIVETSEEFGAQGEAPSHPELLDWLATEYIRVGWDTKKLLKLIVTSSTYKQSSQSSADLTNRDPTNRLLARGPRARLSAEALRDQALAVSGLLSEKLYGPPVHPYQPMNGLAAAFGASTDWETSRGEDCHRRAVYTRWRRNLPYPSMIAFDVPERAVCSMRRIRTSTPIQALVTLNDPVFVEAAQALARTIMAKGGRTLESRAGFALSAVLSRPASAAESKRITVLFQEARRSLATVPDRGAVLATKPLGGLPPGLDPLDAAAWTVVGNVLLNLDEALVKR